MQVIDTSKMSRAEWLATRKRSIGASDTGKIAGLHPSRFGLYLEKTGEAIDDEPNEQMWWGSNLEYPIVNRLIDLGEIGPHCQQVMVRSDQTHWQTATLDVLTDAGCVWELKAAGIQTAKGLIDGMASTLPDSWILQAHHQMMCANVREIRFAVFVGHRLELYRFCVSWDEAVGQGLLQLESEFWKHVEDRVPPAEFDPADAALLLKHYREIEGDPIELPIVGFGHHANDYKEAVAAIKYAEIQRDKAKAHLLAAMGNSPSARCGPYLIKRSIVNVKAQEPKPRSAYSYTKFVFSNTESEE